MMKGASASHRLRLRSEERRLPAPEGRPARPVQLPQPAALHPLRQRQPARVAPLQRLQHARARACARARRAGSPPATARTLLPPLLRPGGAPFTGGGTQRPAWLRQAELRRADQS